MVSTGGSQSVSISLQHLIYKTNSSSDCTDVNWYRRRLEMNDLLRFSPDFQNSDQTNLCRSCWEHNELWEILSWRHRTWSLISNPPHHQLGASLWVLSLDVGLQVSLISNTELQSVFLRAFLFLPETFRRSSMSLTLWLLSTVKR